MTPVVCTVGGFDGKIPGDCVRACLASMLDLPALKVPHFFLDTKDGSVAFEAMRVFLEPLGLTQIACPLSTSGDIEDAMSEASNAFGNAHYMLFGDNKKDSGHVVVCRGEEMVHDPSWGPMSPPLIRPTDGWAAMILVKL